MEAASSSQAHCLCQVHYYSGNGGANSHRNHTIPTPPKPILKRSFMIRSCPADRGGELAAPFCFLAAAWRLHGLILHLPFGFPGWLLAGSWPARVRPAHLLVASASSSPHLSNHKAFKAAGRASWQPLDRLRAASLAIGCFLAALRMSTST